MVNIYPHEPDYVVAPHAIIWRPLRWFSSRIRSGEDDLDTYEAVTFRIGNDIEFDLRSYTGHPVSTVTLYTSDVIDDEAEIARIIEAAMQSLRVPTRALAWKRGDSFTFGQIVRNPKDRLLEREARLIALKIMSQEDSAVTITYIKNKVPTYFPLNSGDKRKIAGKNGEVWEQIVRNIVSNKYLFKHGFAQRSSNRLSITEKGKDLLRRIGFL